MSAEHNWTELGEMIGRLGAGHKGSPDATIVIPVNAQGDLDEVHSVLTDIGGYAGRRSLEILLVINNFPSQQMPAAVDSFRQAGVTVVAVADLRQLVAVDASGAQSDTARGDPATVAELRRAGLIMAARIAGLRQAASDNVIFLDADSRLPAPTALIDWYVDRLAAGTQLAHARVVYSDLPQGLSVRLRIALHHLSNWGKRTIFGIPTTRGGDFAVKREMMLKLYDKGLLLDDMSVGSAVKSAGGSVAYAGNAPELSILTSSRSVEGGWFNTIWYFWWRLGYNKRVLTRDTSDGKSDCS